LNDYYETLFDPHEEVCVAFNAKGRSVQSQQSILALPNYADLQYICINPLKERRLDENVTAYRNFLFENDTGLTKAQQARLIKDSGLPYSALVWSGNKSIHVIVSLETPLSNRGEYDFVWLWIYNILCSKVPPENTYDNKTKNPSRFSRAPGGTNVKLDDDGNEIHRGSQDLILVKGRVLDDAMNDWLMANIEHKPEMRKYDSTVPLSDMAQPMFLNKWTLYLLEHGIYEGKRNDSFHNMAYDFIECGFSCEEAIEYVMTNAKHLNDFPRSEIETTFRSAYKRNGRQRDAAQVD
jgi:hypothetical protein